LNRNDDYDYDYDNNNEKEICVNEIKKGDKNGTPGIEPGRSVSNLSENTEES
jgi:hypothetical protein